MRQLTFLSNCCLLLTVLLVSTHSCQNVEQRFRFENSSVYLRLLRSDNFQGYQIMKDSTVLQTISFNNFIPSNNIEMTDHGTFELKGQDDVVVEFELLTSSSDLVHLKVKRTNIPKNIEPMDCVDLDLPHTHWHGGPEDRYQFWPQERQTFTNYSLITKEDHNLGIEERYWVNSKGMFLYIDDTTPLFIEQNSAGHENQLCLRAASRLPYDTRATQFSFTYHLGFAKDARVAHMQAVQNLLGKPTDYPDERMVQHPIWSTWAEYSADINETIVREFGNKIISNGFENSQLEIDDNWEDCYGSHTFSKSKFPNITQLTDDLKKQGFRVTLWIHPFINKDCTEPYKEAKEKGYLVLDHNGNPDTEWWNSAKNGAAYIDFTKPAAQKWFTDRIQRLHTEDGIDSFKFDAGETSWVPVDPVLNGSLSTSPNQITHDYIKTVAAFGPLVEVRSGQRNQDLPIFFRMIDKDSVWGWNNGLVTLITTLLQMNLNGYPFVLPDMIGGNGYDNIKPSAELFVRWLQANVFMPSMQYSVLPWNYDQTTVELTKKFTKLHADYTPQIMDRFKLAVKTGEPVNAPLWWIAPDDNVAHSIYDQFLLGDDIIAAPVIVEGGVVRDIYLPKGQWRDGNTDKIYNGPTWLMYYPAPLDTLPYFVRVGSEQ